MESCLTCWAKRPVVRVKKSRSVGFMFSSSSAKGKFKHKFQVQVQKSSTKCYHVCVFLFFMMVAMILIN